MIIEIRIVRIPVNDVYIWNHLIGLFQWLFWGERDCSVFNCHLRNSIKGALSGCRHYPLNGFCVTGFYGMRLPYHDGIFAQEKSLSTLT